MLIAVIKLGGVVGRPNKIYLRHELMKIAIEKWLKGDRDNICFSVDKIPDDWTILLKKELDHEVDVYRTSNLKEIAVNKVGSFICVEITGFDLLDLMHGKKNMN